MRRGCCTGRVGNREPGSWEGRMRPRAIRQPARRAPRSTHPALTSARRSGTLGTKRLDRMEIRLPGRLWGWDITIGARVWGDGRASGASLRPAPSHEMVGPAWGRSSQAGCSAGRMQWDAHHGLLDCSTLRLSAPLMESPDIKVGRSQRTGSTCAVSPAHLSSSNNHRLNTLRRLLAAAEQAPQPERGLRRRPSTEARKYCSGRSQKNP